ncbi:unnamed protein product [Ostreobium quekettii]|uniref:Uncharacterized protein n=1 Tax=Ostreobium quekettii TaxID=121088 RepID=A0A8S1J1G5_9CHLO|nr:unnamed protein product [Ostreobium quekettii]
MITEPCRHPSKTPWLRAERADFAAHFAVVPLEEAEARRGTGSPSRARGWWTVEAGMPGRAFSVNGRGPPPAVWHGPGYEQGALLGGQPAVMTNASLSYAEERRMLNAEHMAEERRVQALVKDRVVLFFQQYREIVIERFGTERRNMSQHDLDFLLSHAFNDEVARLTPPELLPTQQLNQQLRGQPRYRLVFAHDCQAKSCNDPSCPLCLNNPKRPCGVEIFKRKYFEHDVIIANCKGPIKLQLCDAQTGEVVKINITVELFMLKGTAYDQNFPAGIPHCACDAIGACALLMVRGEDKDDRSKVETPLLLSDNIPNQPNGKLHICLQDGEAVLPSVKVFKSSEALLGGRKTPYRLYAGIPRDSSTLLPETVAPAVDPLGFVVATQRAKLQEKKGRPFLADPIASLDQIGGRRVETLGCLDAKIDLPAGVLGKVHTVKDFLTLGNDLQRHPHHKKEILTLLKMNDLQWAEAWKHAKTAVQADNKLRVWWFTNTEGLLYECETGEVKLKGPAGYISCGETPHAMPCSDFPPDQQESLNDLHKDALRSYGMPGHPGWEVYPYDSIDFKAKPSAIRIARPTKLIIPLPKVEGEPEAADSGRIVSGLSELSLDDSRFNSCLGSGLNCFRGGYSYPKDTFSYPKDEMSMESVEVEGEAAGATAMAEAFGSPQSEYPMDSTLMPHPGDPGCSMPPPQPRIPHSPPDSAFTAPSRPTSLQQQPCCYSRPDQFNDHRLTINPAMAPPMHIAGQIALNIKPKEAQTDPNGERGAEQFEFDPGRDQFQPDTSVHAAHRAFAEDGIGQPFQDVDEMPINSEDLGSWRCLPTSGEQFCEVETAKSMLQTQRDPSQFPHPNDGT